MAEESEQEKAEQAAEDRIGGIVDVLMSGEDREWLEQESLYLTRVELGGDDYARLEALSGEVVQKLINTFGELAEAVEETPEEQSERAEHFWQVLSENSSTWKLLAEIECQVVQEWTLATYADVSGDKEPRVPREIEDEEARLEALKDLPVNVHWRILYGVLWAIQQG